ncbi:MAG: cytochrome C peroxidase [Bacteroidota bacterium]|nr:cytochrome C peroxidase [Bacteroidota bacterium]
MKKFTIIAAILIAISCYLFYSCNRLKPNPEKAIAQTLIAQVDSFAQARNNLLAAVKSNQVDEKKVQNLFLDTRLAYKKMEWAIEFFDPQNSRFVNGPPVQEIEMTGQIFEPAGLQVIEMLLFPKYDPKKKPELINQLNLLQTGIDRYKRRFKFVDILDWQVFDATKQEVFRVLALGISGFDNPLTLKSMHESATALRNVQQAITLYGDRDDAEKMNKQFTAACSYLEQHPDFNSFDRAKFITQYGNPLTISITELEKKLKLHIITYNYLLNQGAKTLFDKDAFNVNAYAPGLVSYTSEKKIALGRVLFADPILSGGRDRSCQSCHQPDKAFTDGLVKNAVIGTNLPLKRNTPTLINAALQPSQFYDLRAGSLEDQANTVVGNKDEMHGSMKMATERLWQDKDYRRLFSDAFPLKQRTAIDTMEVMNAIGSYVRSLVSLNTRFDQYMRGNKTAMNQEEINGFNLFMGKAKCGTCHYMPLFNGVFPPMYALNESEVIGVPKTIAKTEIDTDMGRYNILKVEAFKHAFKISTVRGAARTAPYMHNGVFTTLEQVMDFYNKGGGAGLGYKVENQTLAPSKLNLTEKESGEVIAFIKALN